MRKSTLLLLLFVTAAINAQSKTNVALPSLSQSEFTVVERNSDGTIKSVRYAPTDNDVPATANEFFSSTLKKRDVDDFVLDISNDADYGMHFECYQQYYQGVRVDDGFYNFRFKNGRMKGVKGHYVNVKDINPVPSITEKEAVDLYATYFGIETSDTIKSYVKLMIKEIPNADSQESVAALVYKVFLLTNRIEGGYVGYIDAHTGKLLYKKNAAVSSSSGLFYTYYNSGSNPKSGFTENNSATYLLKDLRSGYNIWTYNLNQHGSGPFLFFDYDNVWEQSELGSYNIALDVHWTMEQIHDQMKNSFNHHGFDGSYHKVESYIYDGATSYYNDATKTFFFGIASGSSVYGPLASVDKIGHEYGHAILFESSGLDDSGNTKAAIHEGLADIWAIIFEKRITPSANYWKFGEQYMINGKSCERNFQNPNDATAYTQISSTYGYGLFNSTDSHIKGGLLPYWFYLLVNGGSGTNGLNNSYQLIPIGYNLAEDLFIYTTLQTNYLHGSTSFQDVRDAILDALDDIGDDYLAEHVQNALYAVGLYTEPQHIYMQSYSPGSATYYVYGNSNCSVSWSYTSISGSTPTLVPNSSNYSCTVNASSSFSGNLNATISYSGGSVTYSRYITGMASPSSTGGDVMQVVQLDGSHYQLSVGGELRNGTLRVYDASSLQMKVTESQVNENYMLDISSWKRGLYIVEMTIGSKTYTTKLAVK